MILNKKKARILRYLFVPLQTKLKQYYMKDYNYYYYLEKFSEDFRKKNLERINKNYADRFRGYDTGSI